MNFLSKLFASSSSDDGDAESFICDSCGEEVDSATVDNICDLCNDCYENGDSATKYCCGMIYEEGETTCMSCGDPL
jgi:hypothetical protein